MTVGGPEMGGARNIRVFAAWESGRMAGWRMASGNSRMRRCKDEDEEPWPGPLESQLTSPHHSPNRQGPCSSSAPSHRAKLSISKFDPTERPTVKQETVSFPFPSLSWCSWFQLKIQSRPDIFLRKFLLVNSFIKSPPPFSVSSLGENDLCQQPTSRFSFPWDSKDSLKPFLGMAAWLSLFHKGSSHVY